MDLERILTKADTRDWQTTDPESVEQLRFAVVGTGSFTRKVALPGMVDSDYCDVSAIVSRSERESERVGREVGTEVRGLTYDEFLEGDAVDSYDAVYIVIPNGLHLQYATVAAENGKHVLCEKPMERDSQRAEQMVSVCADNDVELMVAYRMQTEPAVRRARELLASGFVGDPIEVRGSMSQRLLDDINPDLDQWRLDVDLAGGGALFDIGIYPLNTARFLLDSDPIAVIGRTRNIREGFEEVDESTTFTVEFTDGVYGSFFSSYNARQSSAIHVTGTEGTIGIEPAFFPEHDRVIHLSSGDGRASVELEPIDQLRAEFDYFAHQIRTGNEITPDGDHGLVDMHAMEAVYEADERGEWVPL